MEEKEFGEFPFRRGELLTDLNRIADWEKVKSMLKSIDDQMKTLTESLALVPNNPQWKNPRQEMLYSHDTTRLTALRKQRDRLARKLAEIEESIKIDIDASNKLQRINT